jgi:translation initiation factor 5B
MTGSVAISIAGEPKVQAGKDFDEKERLVSMISRKSIDCLKEHYRNDVSKDEW